MLEFIRKRAQTWFAWVIVGLLIIPFALWGINQYFGGGGSLVAATVNGQEISMQLYQQSFQQQKARMQEMLGAQYDAGIYDQRLRQQVINRLIEEELLRQKALDAGFAVSEASIAQTIQDIEAFHEDGKFSRDAYVRQLQLSGDSPASFEQRVRRFLLVSQWESGLAGTALTTADEVAAILRLQQQKRSISYLIFPVNKFATSINVSDEDIAAYYQDHQDRYSTPEQVSLDYIELSAAQLGAALHPNEDELKAFFENHKSQFVVPEQRKVSHILIEVPEGADDAAEQNAQREIAELQEQLAKGADFAELAREHSDDPGSAKQGGDLGYVGRGQLDPSFEEAAFALQQDTVSEPVRSAFGYHLIKIADIKGQAERNFADVKAAVLEEYRKAEGERLYFEQSETLTTATFENPDSLQPAAEAMGLEVKSTPLVARGSQGPGVLQHKQVIDAAFGDEVLNQGFNSQPIEIGEHDVAVVRVREHQKAAVKPLNEVRDMVRQDLIGERAQVKARELGEAALAKLREGSAPAAVAKETGVEVHDAGTLGRSDRSLNPILLGNAFELPRPVNDQPSFGTAQLANGDYAVLMVSAVEDGDPEAVDDAARQNIRRSLASARGSAEFQALVQALKAEAEITINQDNL